MRCASAEKTARAIRLVLFVEPEGIDTDEMYIQGMSSSLPEDVQEAFYKTIPGQMCIRDSLEAAITFGIIYFVVRVALKKHDSEKEKALKDDK